jgi:tRNA:m4X modification enzyme
MKTCNDRKVEERWANEPFHVLSINAGPEPALILPDAPPELADLKGRVDTPACRRLAYATNLGPEALNNLVSRLDAVSKQIEKLSPDIFSILREDAVEKLALRASTGGPHVPFSQKHGAQHASLVGNMDEFGLLKHPKDTMFIEFGAGKGYLTNALVEMVPEADTLIMMDNQKFKLIADRRLRKKNMQRLKCDLANFEPCGVQGFDKIGYWVAHGKHLCGAATDLSLRCCHRYLQSGRAEMDGEGGGEGGGGGNKNDDTIQPECTLLGLGIATCCHHRCCWQHYVAQDVILELGFSPEEFEILSYCTSWALCGHGGATSKTSADRKRKGKDSTQDGTQNAAGCEDIEEESNEEEVNEEELNEDEGDDDDGAWRLHHSLSREARQLVGKQSKRLIDYGRVEWLCRNGFDAIEVLYCDPECSGENRMILARRRNAEVALPSLPPSSSR